MVMACSLVACCVGADKPEAKDGWIRLFDGKSLDGWKVGNNAASFKVQDGVIVVNGPVGHLFYVGDAHQHDFKNFEFKASVMTFPKANSGIYFHTRYQETGWPSVGYESQVNNSHKDPIRSGSLYGVKNVFKVPSKDSVWYTQQIIVRGKHIVVKIDDTTVVDYVEQPGDIKGTRCLSHGTFAFQAHDPGSKVYFKDIMVKPLAD